MKTFTPIKLAPIALLLLIAGCAEDWRPATLADGASQAAVGSLAASRVPVAAAARAFGITSFANLPDRGDLVGYPAQRVVRRDGAYTWHRADLSESHALQAIVDGSLRVTAPSGEILDFAYERHVEHPSGDWSWIGRLKNGAASDEVILTFGAKAAFGTIAQPGKAPLKLTIQDGVSWLIETDRSKIAGIDNHATRPDGPDFLVAPKLASRPGMTSSGRMAASAPMTASATSSSGPTIDLVLGYTTGFANALGGQSQAVTRLNNMVDITNQAYANSQVAGRVRLVHTLQVSYADNTSNEEALEKLTGYQSGTGTTTPAAAFSALRAARDQYGADLVSLVRKFNDPENDGCGIAWLVGGGQSGFHGSDEYFGYSIVADGRDQGTDGKTYFCREETLAHELGHNMGSQHDSGTAGTDEDTGEPNYGVYPYSFGYKTSSGDFYTVMAYGDSGQTSYGVFSNPRITYCGGFACGVTDQADNARSLGQAMPTIAAFRAQVVSSGFDTSRVMYDLDSNGDGKSDLLWSNAQTGQNIIWNSANSATLRGVSTIQDLDWAVVAGGDFNGDGRSDIVWRNARTGKNTIWRSANSATLQAMTAVTNPQWSIAGAGDFDGDGRSDVLWNNGSTGQSIIWRSANSGALRNVASIKDLDWRVAAVGDFNGDGRSDIVWRNSRNGMNTIWRSANAGTLQAMSQVSNNAWRIAGAGDFDGDGVSDVLWNNASTGQSTIWRSANSGALRGVATIKDLNWKVGAVGDFDGDGRADILWRNSATGANVIWRSANSSTTRSVSAVTNNSWSLASG